MLNITRQQINLLFRENIIEVVHAAFSAVGDNFLQAIGAFFQRFFWFKAFTRRPFTEHAVTTGATLEIEGFGSFKFLVGNGWRLVLSES